MKARYCSASARMEMRVMSTFWLRASCNSRSSGPSKACDIDDQGIIVARLAPHRPVAIRPQVAVFPGSIRRRRHHWSSHPPHFPPLLCRLASDSREGPGRLFRKPIGHVCRRRPVRPFASTRSMAASRLWHRGPAPAGGKAPRRARSCGPARQHRGRRGHLGAFRRGGRCNAVTCRSPPPPPLWPVRPATLAVPAWTDRRSLPAVIADQPAHHLGHHLGRQGRRRSASTAS